MSEVERGNYQKFCSTLQLTSSTVSVDLSPAFSSIAVMTRGFLRMCWPRSVLKTRPCATVAPAGLAPFIPALVLTRLTSLCTRHFFCTGAFGILERAVYFISYTKNLHEIFNKNRGSVHISNYFNINQFTIPMRSFMQSVTFDEKKFLH